jgi:hypothetical protein
MGHMLGATLSSCHHFRPVSSNQHGWMLSLGFVRCLERSYAHPNARIYRHLEAGREQTEYCLILTPAHSSSGARPVKLRACVNTVSIC